MEQMTKERLLSYRSNKAEILELDYAINNRWKSDTMIGNDVIFDYSKGYPMPQSVTGFDSEKYERLQIRDMERKERLKKECEEIERFVDDIKDSITHRIFRIYFIDGRKNVTLREVGVNDSNNENTIVSMANGDASVQPAHVGSSYSKGAWNAVFDRNAYAGSFRINYVIFYFGK